MENNAKTRASNTSAPNPFAQLIARRRREQNLTYRQLATATGIAVGTLHKFEQGQAQLPSPSLLPALARALRVPLADMYVAAGYESPTALPTFTPYLRSKYKGLPDGARAELDAAFDRIVTKYGYDPNAAGPDGGEDEQP